MCFIIVFNKIEKMPTVKRDYSNEELEKWLDRDFTSVFRSGYVNVKGVTMPRRFEELQSDIFNWNVSERDVWICSFPKTGTTWTQEMVWMIMNNLDIIKGQENLGIRSPFLEVTALFDYRKFQKENTDFQPPPFIEDSLKFVREKSQKGSLCLKTHLPWVLLPQEIQNNTKQPKVGNFYTPFLGVKLLKIVNNSEILVTFAPYWNHVLPFWEKRNQPNILFLKYEKMIQDLPSIIKEVADFLETPLTPEQITTLSDHLSFESMKKNPAVNYEMIVSLNRKFKLIECDGTFMRSGKVGDYKAKMSPEIIQAFDEWTAENVQGTDFSF
uniref:Estrogen sulfotransferase, testis isoform-like n=1 Tax=Diabrotica virgifera virgifera TaxID=50390 RepID=A0A6P7EY40_DIAVI